MFPWIMELLSDYINKLQIFLAVTRCPVLFYSDTIQSDFIILIHTEKVQ